MADGVRVTVKDRSKAYLANAQNELERAIALGAIRVQREAQRLVGLRSGPIKSLPGAVPSAPGEPPHLRTGTLRRSIDHETLRLGNREFVGRVGPTGAAAKYGTYLELGTRKMAPRPYLRPALDSQRKQIVAEIRRAGRRF